GPSMRPTISTTPSASLGAGSAFAHAAVLLPSRSSVRGPDFWSSLPQRPSAAATRLTGPKGPGAAWRPNSYASSRRSTTPWPLTLPPPACSGTARDVHPSSDPRRQYGASNPDLVPARLLAALRGASDSRKRLVVSWNRSWSSLPSNIASDLPPPAASVTAAPQAGGC